MKLLLLLVPALLLAQDPKPEPAKTEPAATEAKAEAKTEITAELRAKYWRAQNELNQAETAASKARDRGREVVTELSKACGANLPVKLDAAGEPACTPNPPLPVETPTPQK